MLRFSFAFLLCVLNQTAFCQIITHPTSININPVFDPIHEISGNEVNFEAISDEGIKLAERILNYKTLFTLGKAAGETGELFGDVLSAHIDEANSRLFVIDTQNIGVLTYDLQGNYLSKISREGRGPGELQNPFSVISSGNKLFVLDRFYNIKKFEGEAAQFIFSEDLNPKYRPESFCLNNGNLVVKTAPVTDPASAQNQHSIFVYPSAGASEPASSFGKLYRSDSWFPVMHISLGGVECAPESPAIVQYFDYLNLLYGFNSDGKLTWISKINSFNFLELLELPNGSLSPDQKKRPIHFDAIYRTISVNENYFIVQVANRTISRNGYALNGIKSYLISYRNGKGTLLPNTLPAILSVSQHHIAFLIKDDFHQILIGRY